MPVVVTNHIRNLCIENCLKLALNFRWTAVTGYNVKRNEMIRLLSLMISDCNCTVCIIHFKCYFFSYTKMNCAFFVDSDSLYWRLANQFIENFGFLHSANDWLCFMLLTVQFEKRLQSESISIIPYIFFLIMFFCCCWKNHLSYGRQKKKFDGPSSLHSMNRKEI